MLPGNCWFQRSSRVSIFAGWILCVVAGSESVHSHTPLCCEVPEIDSDLGAPLTNHQQKVKLFADFGYINRSLDISTKDIGHVQHRDRKYSVSASPDICRQHFGDGYTTQKVEELLDQTMDDLSRIMQAVNLPLALEHFILPEGHPYINTYRDGLQAKIDKKIASNARAKGKAKAKDTKQRLTKSGGIFGLDWIDVHKGWWESNGFDTTHGPYIPVGVNNHIPDMFSLNLPFKELATRSPREADVIYMLCIKHPPHELSEERIIEVCAAQMILHSLVHDMWLLMCHHS